ncbi:hypothetical protein ACO2Q1_06330 [Brevundimonas sp. VNH65]|uniref:hypothetical protein n=1 Tax=Brevundimonas sp. VNH65 TaxID=3400917 RepID=UPI003C0A5B56
MTHPTPGRKPPTPRPSGLAATAILGLILTGPSALASAPIQPRAAVTKDALAGRSGDGQDRQLRIHNQTGWTMTRLIAVGRGTRAAGRDRLLNAALRPGDSLAIDMDDGSGGCVYDLHAEFANGQALVRPDVNVCRIADFYYTR